MISIKALLFWLASVGVAGAQFATAGAGLAVPTTTAVPAIDASGVFSANSSGAITSLPVVVSTTSPNDIVELFFETNLTSDVPASVSGGGLTWTQRAVSKVSGTPSFHEEEWWALAASPLTSASITVTFNTTSNFTTIVAFGVANANTTTPFDVNGALPNLSTTGLVAVTTTAATTMTLAGYRTGSGASPTTGSGFTQLYGSNFMLVEYQNVVAPQSALSMTIGTGSGTQNGGIGDAIQ